MQVVNNRLKFRFTFKKIFLRPQLSINTPFAPLKMTIIYTVLTQLPPSFITHHTIPRLYIHHWRMPFLPYTCIHSSPSTCKSLDSLKIQARAAHARAYNTANATCAIYIAPGAHTSFDFARGRARSADACSMCAN